MIASTVVGTNNMKPAASSSNSTTAAQRSANSGRRPPQLNVAEILRTDEDTDHRQCNINQQDYAGEPFQRSPQALPADGLIHPYTVSPVVSDRRPNPGLCTQTRGNLNSPQQQLQPGSPSPQQRFARSGCRGSVNSNLFIRNLSARVEQAELNEAFGAYGTILSSAVMRDIHTGDSLGTAFVRFSTREEAEDAMEAMRNHRFDGQAITVQWAKKCDGAPVGEARKMIMKLFVRNIPLECTVDDLTTLFGQYGPVSQVSIHKDTAPSSDRNFEKHIAFVIYKAEGAAERAATAVHNTKPFDSCHGIPIMVKLAEDNYVKHDRRGDGRHESGSSLHTRRGLSGAPYHTGESTPNAAAATSPAQSPHGGSSAVRGGAGGSQPHTPYNHPSPTYHKHYPPMQAQSPQAGIGAGPVMVGTAVQCYGPGRNMPPVQQPQPLPSSMGVGAPMGSIAHFDFSNDFSGSAEMMPSCGSAGNGNAYGFNACAPEGPLGDDNQPMLKVASQPPSMIAIPRSFSNYASTGGNLLSPVYGATGSKSSSACSSSRSYRHNPYSLASSNTWLN